jgi:hypothetical protein
MEMVSGMRRSRLKHAFTPEGGAVRRGAREANCL